MEAIENALALNEDLASAWANLAYQKRFYDLDWEGAMAAIDRALELEPNNAQVLGKCWVSRRLWREVLAESPSPQNCTNELLLLTR
jgi:tetratricopeptide (TPR) repeat protein